MYDMPLGAARATIAADIEGAVRGLRHALDDPWLEAPPERGLLSTYCPSSAENREGKADNLYDPGHGSASGLTSGPGVKLDRAA